MNGRKRTPWGLSDDAGKTYAEGIVFYSTPGHGGFHVDAARNRLVHEAWRKAGGWYEEDCEWAIVAVTFPDAFPGEAEHAHAMAKDYEPDAYTVVTGKPVSLEESTKLRDRAFAAEHASDYVATAAWGDWANGVPEGAVGVHAVRGGRHPSGRYASDDIAYFLVPADEYAACRGGGICRGFVIDPTRHARVDDISALGAKPRAA